MRKQVPNRVKAPRAKAKPIVIKGCTAWFDGIHYIDQLIIKLLVFAGVVCLVALICL